MECPHFTLTLGTNPNATVNTLHLLPTDLLSRIVVFRTGKLFLNLFHSMLITRFAIIIEIVSLIFHFTIHIFVMYKIPYENNQWDNKITLILHIGGFKILGLKAVYTYIIVF